MNAPRDPDERRRVFIRMAALIATAFVAGMAVRGIGGAGSARDEATRVRAAADRAAEAVGPTGERAGMPIGFAHTEDGARAAGVAYVLAGQRLLALPPTRVGDAIRAITASASADAQVADTDQQLRRLREVLAEGTGPIRYLQAVLATRVDAYTPERARISVWNVGVLSRSGAAQPQAGWNVSTFELVWERGDWRIWSETITPGPAPALNAGAAPASHEQLDRALNGFTPWRA